LRYSHRRERDHEQEQRRKTSGGESHDAE
jgi:hypothetical protein